VAPSVSTGMILEAVKAGDVNAFLGAVALAGATGASPSP
jgi:hypothetical protein